MKNVIKQELMKTFCTCPPSGNQVDGVPLALHKDAVPASWLRSGRAPKRKIYKKMYTVDKFSDVRLLVIHEKISLSIH